MRSPRAVLTAMVLAILGLLAVVAPSASAITGGEPDGNRHPNVGLILFYTEDGRFRCSATLISPTVLLTAAHCTAGTVGDTLVNFEWFIDDEPPSSLPRAADDTGDGISKIGYQGSTDGWLSGTAYTHPAYSDFTDLKNWNDVGVIVLDAPVTTITPVTIAPTNYLNQFTPNVLNKTLFTSVGYGTEVRQAESGPQKPTPMSYPIVRRFTDEVGQKLTPQVLQVNGNENDPRGGGGTCFGDSGGPSFNGGYQVTVTSYGYTSNCRYLGGLQRIDIPIVQAWLAGFGVGHA